MIQVTYKENPAINWASENPVLPQGAIGFDTTNKRFKFGDGKRAWNDIVEYYSLGGNASSYKVYSAFLVIGDPPTITLLENTIDEDLEVNWARDTEGVYQGVFSDTYFTAGKTFCLISPPQQQHETAGVYSLHITTPSDTVIDIRGFLFNGSQNLRSDNALTAQNIFFEVRVYN